MNLYYSLHPPQKKKENKQHTLIPIAIKALMVFGYRPRAAVQHLGIGPKPLKPYTLNL